MISMCPFSELVSNDNPLGEGCSATIGLSPLSPLKPSRSVEVASNSPENRLFEFIAEQNGLLVI